VKDIIDTMGIETRYGSPAYIGHIPASDATVVRRLPEARAIVVGKTTTHEFAWGVTTSSPKFADTLNPADPARILGGSSGGSSGGASGVGHRGRDNEVIEVAIEIERRNAESNNLKEGQR
jgi:aspartyl-tRNA(Asn)/glutamyl-tRNA(Gln) amidotransferase subunit A